LASILIVIPDNETQTISNSLAISTLGETLSNRDAFNESLQIETHTLEF
jgi:hypothetical protein